MAVVLVAAGVAGFLIFGEKPSPTTPPPTVPTDTARPSPRPDTTEPPLGPDQVAAAREHAEKFVAAINAKDEAAATALTCEKQRPGGVYLTAVEHAPVRLAEKPRLVDVERAVFDVEVEPGRLFALEVVGPETWCVFT
ncbi:MULTISPECIES: hypothetical protein [Actinokineospora]|uniref:hypothetical protein n=1 Tax=Actinokineospora TaxID=39845 RepID=UPI00167098AB|nr:MULTISPECIES: hypothetical protein [Actinokineospora]UVS82327.1 hypothetical protein Actkin_06096 [Actinokineospora sp. UTMC 2448]